MYYDSDAPSKLEEGPNFTSWRQHSTHLGVYPELVEKVELFVHQVGRRRHCQGHWQVEYLKQVDTHTFCYQCFMMHCTPFQH